MKQYKILNNVVGWITFLIAAVTYILTTEASASFWDCGEFISTSNKLLVGHPPGAPFFMIIGRMFALLAPDVTLIAKMVNIMSALCSAFTILFLFWTITHLARRIFIDNQEGEPEAWRTWAVIGAGAVGALAYTFSDTFWFSAVEGEVYAMSSLFTAVVFWAILKWEDQADEPHSNRWLILIAYLMGLSIGVHLLNLLTIPAIVMVFYFKKYEVNRANTIKALLLSGALIIVILYGIIPGVVKLASYFELAFVNAFGLGYNSGAAFYALLLIALIIIGIYYTYTHEHRVLNLIITGIAVIILGYSSFAMVVIRSVANPTMDQNSPEDVFALMNYMNREQYGDRPLFYGQSFASPLDRNAMQAEKGKPIYIQRNGKYEIADYKQSYKWQAQMLFPRMYSREDRHITEYKAWSNFEGRKATVYDEETGQMKQILVPTFGENLLFFLRYQCNFMYWRYFMWNFSGRQNDIQGHGELTHGNWITGIDFIDNAMLGDQSLMPDTLKNNKGHNRYFMLPFLLGLAGLFFQFGRGRVGVQGFWVVMMFFFLTGLAIIIYLNQTPLQPRERDYAYAGSFYAFTIWIGLGVLAIVEAIRKIRVSGPIASIVATVVCLLCVPCIMAEQNWDDHDRSGCTIARDLGYNYLNSCDENAVIFTNGDNDTFPLWYAQEVEGIRTDVRVCNLSYLQTDWYCDQMKRKAYDSEPLPITFTHDQYTADRDVIYLMNQINDYIDLNMALDFVRSDDIRTKSLSQYPGEHLNYIPGRKFKLAVDSAAVLRNNVVSAEYADDILDTLYFSVNKSYILKNELMVLDMLANSKWERPLYYAVTVGSENYVGLEKFFLLEGLAYHLAPLNRSKNGSSDGRVDTEKMYDKVMNKFRWGFYNKPGLYIDENKMRMASNLRNNLARLALTLLKEAEEATNDSIKARKMEMGVNVIDKLQYELPDSVIPHNYFSLKLAHGYYVVGADSENEIYSSKGDDILHSYALDNLQELQFYTMLESTDYKNSLSEVQRCMAIYNAIAEVAENWHRGVAIAEFEDAYDQCFQRYNFEVYGATR